MTTDRKKTETFLQSLTYRNQGEGHDVLITWYATITEPVITFCQLNEIRERMLIVRRFQSTTTYFSAKKRPCLVFFNFVVIFNRIFTFHLSGKEAFFVGFLRNVPILTSG